MAVLLAATARGAGRDPGGAQALFDAGRAAMGHGDYAVACKRFEESQRLDPAAGTLMNWAECLSRRGKRAASLAKWREAVDALPEDDERRGAATERIVALERDIPRLEIRLSPGAPRGTLVRRDGVTLDAVTLGLAVPVDPGSHTVSVIARGRSSSEQIVTLADGEHRVVVVAPGPLVPLSDDTRAESKRPAGTTPVVGYVVGAVGAASLLTGVTFGILAIVEKGRMDDGCQRSSGALICGSSGLDAAHSGQTYATIANITVPVGLFGLGLGGYLIFSARPSEGPADVRREAEVRFASTF